MLFPSWAADWCDGLLMSHQGGAPLTGRSDYDRAMWVESAGLLADGDDTGRSMTTTR